MVESRTEERLKLAALYNMNIT